MAARSARHVSEDGVRRRHGRDASQASTAVDITLGDTPAEAVGLEIVNKLAIKGFCVLAPGIEESTIQTALDEISELAASEKWYKVNSIIQDGLLGAEGSAQISELEPPDADETTRDDGDVLMKLDFTMTHIGFRMEPYWEHLGVDITHRSTAVLHKTGEPFEDKAPLTEKQVLKWLAQFLRHRIMVIVFLGPTTGTLELKPYDTDDAEFHAIRSTPGTAVILRPDMLSHRHFASGTGNTFAISCFFLTGSLPKRTSKEGWHMVPAARELDEWTMNRLRELKEKTTDDIIWDPDIPRDFQNAMNHLYHKGQMIGVYGTACNFPVSDIVDQWYQVSVSAPDYVTDVPLLRWDHDEIYDPDSDSWKYHRSYCKHASFMDGIELFDCKESSISSISNFHHFATGTFSNHLHSLKFGFIPSILSKDGQLLTYRKAICFGSVIKMSQILVD